MTQEKKTTFVLLALIALIVFIYFRFGQDGPTPVMKTINRLNALETSVIHWAKENGKIPATLAELELPADAVIDHAGIPFHFNVAGRIVTISAFGADGKPGGVMFKADHSVQFQVPE